MYEQPTPLQQLIEEKVTNGQSFTSESPYHGNRDYVDELDLQHHLGISQVETMNYDNLFYVVAASIILSGLRIIEALRDTRKYRTYTTVAEVNEAIDKHGKEIRDKPHPLEETKMFADCKGDPEFREWCAAGRDPMYYPGPIILR